MRFSERGGNGNPLPIPLTNIRFVLGSAGVSSKTAAQIKPRLRAEGVIDVCRDVTLEIYRINNFPATEQRASDFLAEHCPGFAANARECQRAPRIQLRKIARQCAVCSAKRSHDHPLFET